VDRRRDALAASPGAARRLRPAAPTPALLVLGVATAAAAGLGTLVVAQLSTSSQRLPDALRMAARDVGRLDGMGAATVQRTRSALAELDRTVARVTGTPPSPPAARAAPASGSLVASAVESSTEWILGAGRAGFAFLLQAGVIVMLAFFLLCSGDGLAQGLSRWVDGRPLGAEGASLRWCRRWRARCAATARSWIRPFFSA
jgi:predicted PurR-regulated permease PerM